MIKVVYCPYFKYVIKYKFIKTSYSIWVSDTIKMQKHSQEYQQHYLR